MVENYWAGPIMSSPNPNASWAEPTREFVAASGDKPSKWLIERIAYLDALRFIFSNRDWLKGVLLGGIAMLIPVLSQLIAFGYSYEIVELLHRRQTTSYPIFDFRHFAKYVTRGVWPFLIAFIVQTVLQPVMQFGIQGSVMGTMFAFEADETIGAIVAAIVIPTTLIGTLAIVIGLMLVLTPLLMRAGLSQDFAQAFKLAWIKDFIRRMWMETILVNLFMILTTLVFLPLGCVLFCFPGLMVAMALTTAGAHLTWQLYELYLARGGEPIPLKPLPADVPPVIGS
jgi:hypothetical protein